jgi:hypothetical protein
LLLLAAACGDDSTAPGGGGSGSGGAITGAGGEGGEGFMPFSSCDAIEACEQDPMLEENARNSCVECAVLGDGSTAPDGGTCGEAYDACFGPSDDCTDAGAEPDCCAFYECVIACDADQSGELDDRELDCFCTNQPNETEQLVCVALSGQMPGTCLGDHAAGFELAYAYEDCVYGITAPGVCAESCN